MSNSVQFTRIAAAIAAAVCVLGACAQTGSSPAARDASGAPTAEATKALAAYPEQPDEPGVSGGQRTHYQRYVISLPPLPGEEDARQIELIAGRVMTVDCNRQRLGGGFASRTVNGWGYPYWVFEGAGPGVSTRMACPPGSGQPAFVSAPPAFARYDSRLPLVVYLPDDFELRWRVWQAGAQQSAERQ